MPAFCAARAVVVARQEDHAGGVLADRRQLEVHDRAEEGIRHLGQDAGAVTRAGIRADRTAVLEVAQRGQREIDDVVPGLAAQRRDHRQAAGVLLERRVVHALLLREAGMPDGAVLAWGGDATGARSHINRPHVDAQNGTTSARAPECRERELVYFVATVLVAVPRRFGFGRRGFADVDEVVGVLRLYRARSGVHSRPGMYGEGSRPG